MASKGPALTKALTIADLEIFSKSALCTNSSAFSRSKTHQGLPIEVEPSVVFHAIRPASVPTRRRGPRPNIGTWTAPLVWAPASERISLIASFRMAVDSSAPLSIELRVIVHAEEFPKTMRSRSPLPVSSSEICSIGPRLDCVSVPISGRPFSSMT